jgi:hypothetical protein
MAHPRQQIRDSFEAAIKAIPDYMPDNKIIVGNVFQVEDKKLPYTFVILGNESETLLTQLNSYSRDLTLYVVIKCKNKERLSAIIEGENFARQIEDQILDPFSPALIPIIKSINYLNFEISEPKENDPTYSIQLSFSVKYTDSF